MLYHIRPIVVVLFILLSSMAGYPAEKRWIGAGDGISWGDSKNWFPESLPAQTDDVIIDLQYSNVICERTFSAGSITVGGTRTSSLSIDEFIYGTIAPSTTSDDAIHIRKDGTVILKGAGIITLKGRFKNSEESLPGEESFMFTLE